MDKALSFIGLMKKAGKLEIGEESVSSAAVKGKARAILSSCDASPRSLRGAKGIAETWDIPHMTLPFTKDELGSVIGRGSPGITAVTDIGFAAKLAEQLAANDPEGFGVAADTLRQTRDSIRSRAESARRTSKRRM